MIKEIILIYPETSKPVRQCWILLSSERGRERENVVNHKVDDTHLGAVPISAVAVQMCVVGGSQKTAECKGWQGLQKQVIFLFFFFILLTRMLLQCRHRNSFQEKEIGSKLLNTGIKVFQPDIENPQQAYPFHQNCQFTISSCETS